ncbi:hypothetical protein [Mycobacterium marinum]|uniref:hypothetical protein n=1 Tax=Mycobacterium marinum TaxID=1781 RepID=UPI003562A994
MNDHIPTPIDPSLARMHESMGVAHRAALDAILSARTTGMRDGVQIAADLVHCSAKTEGMPSVIVDHLVWLGDCIELLAREINDPGPTGGVNS